jgi:hypothetical protein
MMKTVTDRENNNERLLTERTNEQPSQRERTTINTLTEGTNNNGHPHRGTNDEQRTTPSPRDEQRTTNNTLTEGELTKDGNPDVTN